VRRLESWFEPVAVVLDAGAPHSGAVRRSLQECGHEVIVVTSPAELLAVALTVPVRVVVTDACATNDGTVPVPLAAADSIAPGAHVVVIHGPDDVPGMWRTYRDGALPWTTSSPLELGTALDPVPVSGEAAAVEALHHELLGRHVRACEAIAAVRDPDDVVELIETLLDAGAAALDRLRARSRYPVPTDLVVAQLPAHVGGSAFPMCWSMLQAMAFRSSGLHLPLLELEMPEQRFGAAEGAFHAASTIVRFTARRQWRRPTELLGDLAVAT